MSRRVAAVDQGTNSTRLLVADVSAGGVAEVQRLLTITRLGDGVDRTGHLSDESIGRVMSTLDGYADAAKQDGAEVVLMTATSAVRDASNGPEFLADVERRYGFTTRVLTGEDEARMTFRGVTSARPPDGPVLVSDIGGGSTELIAGWNASALLEIDGAVLIPDGRAAGYILAPEPRPLNQALRRAGSPVDFGEDSWRHCHEHDQVVPGLEATLARGHPESGRILARPIGGLAGFLCRAVTRGALHAMPSEGGEVHLHQVLL